MGQLSSRRYEIRRVLGKGGTGVVYEAYDSKDHTVVALKTIDSRQAEHLYRLKHEFRALADVQHENIVRFGELSHEEGEWFFSMELVRGKNFLEYVRPLGPGDRDENGRMDAETTILGNLLPDSGIIVKAAGPSSFPGEGGFDEARLRSALAQLASALAATHEAGHVHRDVKPANVLVTDEGRVVLLDFGLVTALAEPGRRGETGWVVGTPAFMAPEQVKGEGVGPEADWYAVGVVLYLALTGAFPFEGDDMGIFKAKLEREPPSPRERVPGIPADLEALCIDLLRRAPSERPRAEAIRARLGLAQHDPPMSAVTGEMGAVFVGRDSELSALVRAFRDVSEARHAHIVVVDGEPGMGKSSVVQHFLRALPESVLVLCGRCYEQESVPFQGVDTMIDSLSEWLIALPDAETEALIAGGVRYLATVFPVLNRVGKIADATLGARKVASDATLREQAFGEFERLFAAVANRGPLVIFLDDLQWADDDSVALLRRALLQPTGAPCLLIATMRAGADISADATEILNLAERISIHGLSDIESMQLLDALWTQKTPLAEASSERELLMREAAGHPLFLAELVRSARTGHIKRGAHGTLQEVLWERIQVRDAVDRRFLEFVAIAGAPTPYDVVARAAALGVGECQTRLSALRAAQLIRVSRHGGERLVDPYHDRVRESVLHHLQTDDPLGIPARHLQLGRALLESTPEEALPMSVFAIVRHFNAARDLLANPSERLRVAELNLHAGRQGQLATAYDRARQYARDGLALVGAAGWAAAYVLTRDLLLLHMEAEYLAGRPEDARESFDTARARVKSSEDRVAFYARWIGLGTAHGTFTEAIAAGREILRDLGAPLPPRVSTLHVLRQYGKNRIARGSRSIESLVHLEALRDPMRESTLKILMALAPPAFFSDTNLFTWVMLRIAGLSMKYGVCDVSAYGFAGYGTVLAGGFDKHAEGAAFGRLALALNERFKNESLEAKLRLLNGLFILPWTRPFAEAKDELRRSYDAAVKHGDTAYEAYAVTNLSVLSFCGGEAPASLQAAGEWAREMSARRREVDMAGMNATFARYAATLGGLTPDPLDLGTEGSSDAEFGGSLRGKATTLARFYYHFCRAELAYLFRETDRAHELLGEAKKGAQGIFALPTMVELAFLEALVAARRYDGASLMARPGVFLTVATRVRKLGVWAKSCPENFEAHRLIALGELLRIEGRARKAGAVFAQAITAARAYGPAKREAIALELAAAHARAQGKTSRANELGSEAVDAYRRWGAVTKVDPRSGGPAALS